MPATNSRDAEQHAAPVLSRRWPLLSKLCTHPEHGESAEHVFRRDSHRSAACRAVSSDRATECMQVRWKASSGRSLATHSSRCEFGGTSPVNWSTSACRIIEFVGPCVLVVLRRPADYSPRSFAENETQRQSPNQTDARRSAGLTTDPAPDGNRPPSPPRPLATPPPLPGRAGTAPINPRVRSLTSECHVRRSKRVT